MKAGHLNGKTGALVALILSLILFTGLTPPTRARADRVYYEVFVRAFADSDGDGMGDLNGLSLKLDSLKSLGVDGLWLMPIFKAQSYHGYDVTDYRDISPDYGTMEDFDRFLAEAHQKGFKVLLDLPLNHTGDRHPWFIAAKDPQSPLRARYHWLENPTPQALSLKVWGRAVYSPLGSAYYYSLFDKGMPDLNYDCPETRQEAIDIARFWLQRGVDGFRLDAASHIYGEGEGGRPQDISLSAAWWQEFSRALKKDYPDCYLLGEAWESLDKRAPLLTGLDSVLNFDLGDRLLPLLKTGGGGQGLMDALLKVYGEGQKVNPDFKDAPFLSNHDQARVFSRLGYQSAKAKAAAFVLLTLPGNPVIYYGEELGMAGAKPDEELRTPFLWGEGDPFLSRWHPSKYNQNTQPLSLQEQDPQSLLAFYKRILRFRQEHKALSLGKFEKATLSNPLSLAYTLKSPDESLLILHNLSKNEQVISLSGPHSLLFSEGEAKLAGLTLKLPPFSGAILQEEVKK